MWQPYKLQTPKTNQEAPIGGYNYSKGSLTVECCPYIASFLSLQSQGKVYCQCTFHESQNNIVAPWSYSLAAKLFTSQVTHWRLSWEKKDSREVDGFGSSARNFLSENWLLGTSDQFYSSSLLKLTYLAGIFQCENECSTSFQLSVHSEHEGRLGVSISVLIPSLGTHSTESTSLAFKLVSLLEMMVWSLIHMPFLFLKCGPGLEWRWRSAFPLFPVSNPFPLPIPQTAQTFAVSA